MLVFLANVNLPWSPEATAKCPVHGTRFTNRGKSSHLTQSFLQPTPLPPNIQHNTRCFSHQVQAQCGSITLLRLPGEVRNKIHSYVMPEFIIIDTGARAFHGGSHQVWKDGRKAFLLRRVCRQLYFETCMLSFTSTKVRFDSGFGYFKFFKALIPPNELGTISVVYVHDCFDLMTENLKAVNLPGLKRIVLEAECSMGWKALKDIVKEVQGPEVELVCMSEKKTL